MKRKKVTIGVIVILVISAIAVLFLPLTFSYTTQSKVQIKPGLEWELSKNTSGHILTTFKNNINASVSSYSVTEFQRGDVVKFILKEEVLNRRTISRGDTIGYLFSNQEQLKLIELEGNLRILRSEYAFFTTGQKPEDIEKAKRQIHMARQELETQKRLMVRTSALFKDSVISGQEYDIALNEMKVKELAVSIAEANFESVSTGDKPEQSALIKSKIDAISQQIGQIRERINYFTLISPVSGQIAVNRQQPTEILETEPLLRVIDVDTMVGITPIRLSELPYFEIGNEIQLTADGKTGYIISIDNVAQSDWLGSTVYLTSLIQNGQDLMPGKVASVKAIGKELSLFDYILAIMSKR